MSQPNNRVPPGEQPAGRFYDLELCKAPLIVEIRVNAGGFDVLHRDTPDTPVPVEHGQPRDTRLADLALPVIDGGELRHALTLARRTHDLMAAAPTRRQPAAERAADCTRRQTLRYASMPSKESGAMGPALIATRSGIVPQTGTPASVQVSSVSR